MSEADRMWDQAVEGAKKVRSGDSMAVVIRLGMRESLLRGIQMSIEAVKLELNEDGDIVAGLEKLKEEMTIRLGKASS